MPIPFLLAGLTAGAAVVGLGAQMSAKDVNEKAQRLAKAAEDLYNDSKATLDEAQKQTEQSLLLLGNSKRNVLETSMNQFLDVYEQIKDIEISESIGVEEISNFTLDEQGALEIRQMSNIYHSTFSSGSAGAATGAVIALAASGSLPVVTGGLSTAGSALVAGEVGAAAGLAGSALSFGAAMTPLVAIAAPALLFSGISASLKADENLEKAQTMYAEAESAAEEMKTAKLLCEAISKRADMFDGVLSELNEMFTYSTALLAGVVKNKRNIFQKLGIVKSKKVNPKSFTDDEKRLIMVTRALAGAVKAVIDTPILTSTGKISDESQKVYENTMQRVPALNESINYIKSVGYDVSPIDAETSIKEKNEQSIIVKIVYIAIILVIAGIVYFYVK